MAGACARLRQNPAPAPLRRVIARWLPLGALVLAQVGYPLTGGRVRAGLVIATVLLGFAVSVWHAARTRGRRAAAVLLAAAAFGGLAVEALGVHTGFPFGGYRYSVALGPRLLGVPAVVPLAWTWMAWPAWLAATALTRRSVFRVGLAGLGLAAWDLFLDPQMVAEGYWRWRGSGAGLAGVPWTNYVSWLGVALLMMAALAAAGGPAVHRADRAADAPMHALYLWTYASSILAHAVFLRLPTSAVAGALGMGLVAVPLAVVLARHRRLAVPC